MFQSKEEFDLAILKDYDEAVNTYYKLNNVNNERYITKLECKIDITQDEAIHFVGAWETLMLKFNIPSQHHNYILYITQCFYSKLETDNELFNDIQNATSAIDFLISYLKETDIAFIKGKHKTSKEAIDYKITLQLKNIHSGLPITLNYPGATRLLVDDFYKAIRTSDMILREFLHNHKSIPALEYLIEIKETLQFNLDNPHHYYLIETIQSLQRYFNRYLSKELSRKQHLFIFELLHLFNFLKYAGKVDNTPGENFSLDDKKVLERKFNTTIVINDSRKIAIVKAIIKNSKRNSRYHKG